MSRGEELIKGTLNGVFLGYVFKGTKLNVMKIILRD